MSRTAFCIRIGTCCKTRVKIFACALKGELKRLAETVAEIGSSAILVAAIHEREQQLREITDQLLAGGCFYAVSATARNSLKLHGTDRTLHNALHRFFSLLDLDRTSES